MPVNSLSICIPSMGRRDQLMELLRSIQCAIENSGVDANTISVVVCLDGAKDDSEIAMAEIAPCLSFELSWIGQSRRGAAAARNGCIRLARGELLWFLDDDMLINEQALVSHLNARRDKFPVVVGPCELQSINSVAERRTKDWYDKWYRKSEESGVITEAERFSIANTSGPKQIFANNLLDETYSGYGYEDYEIGARLISQGIGIRFDSAAVVLHNQIVSPELRLIRVYEEARNKSRYEKKQPPQQQQKMVASYGAGDSNSERLVSLIIRNLSGLLVLVAKATYRISRVLPDLEPMLWKQCSRLMRIAARMVPE